MKSAFRIFARIILFLSLLWIAFPDNYQAYTDLSTFKIEAGKFQDESKANAALLQLQKDTNWTGTYQRTNEYQEYFRVLSGGFSGQERVTQVLQQFKKETRINAKYTGIGEPQSYYRIISGGFSGESHVALVLQKFKKETGINAKYAGIGEPQNYYQIISGGFSGESRVAQVLQQFKKETGINAKYAGIGEPQNYYQIISGGFSGESHVAQVLQQFKNETGINAKYAGIGEPQNFYQIISGGFSGEARVKQILKQFEETTGINAEYVQTGSNSFRIKSEPVLGLSPRNRGRDFFIKNNWSVTSPLTGKKGYESYRVISDSILGWENVNKSRQFFIKNNWSVTSPITGKGEYKSYRIESDPILGWNEDVKKGRDFFIKNNWSVTSPITGKKGYKSYRIESDPILGWNEDVIKGREFFIKNNWSVTSPLAEKKGYHSYRIVSEPVLGLAILNKGREFFIKNNWSVTSSSTGEKQYFYKIVTQEFAGFDKTQAAAQEISRLYGWSATPVKTKNGPQLMYTDYGMTLGSMVDKQMAGNPQTDKYRNESRYIHVDYVDLNKQTVIGDSVNLRTAPSTTSNVVQQLNNGDRVLVIGKTGDWVEVRLTWQNAQASDVNYYLNPNNFSLNNMDYFQFLKLSKTANIKASEVNQRILNGKGILAGQGQAFVEAANTYNINEVYLISHSLLETGNGSSNLATGVVYNGKTVYNMYGYGAYDSCPLTCGAQKAYENGWFTPEAAIIGGAKFISNDYIYNPAFEQDTLYKMRWNPEQTWHQYATDIGWSYKQVNTIYNLYQMLDNYTLYYDVPSYN